MYEEEFVKKLNKIVSEILVVFFIRLVVGSIVIFRGRSFWRVLLRGGIGFGSV